MSTRQRAVVAAATWMCAATVILIAGCTSGEKSAVAASASSATQTNPQIAQGAERFAVRCARCHGPLMEGIEHAPPLKGEAFQAEWNGKKARELYKRIISTMPQDDPGSLPEQEVLVITEFILSAGNFVLPPVSKANDLNAITLEMSKPL